MKNTLTILLPLLFSIQILAQDYEPMAVEGAHWIVFSIDDQGANHHVFSIEGDTVLTGVEYKKTYRTELFNETVYFDEFSPPYYLGEKKIIGAMRDDVVGRRVFYFPMENFYSAYDTCDIFSDMLIHDFSLEVGDTVGGCLHGYPDYPPGIDSIAIEFLWGKNRRILYSNVFANLVEGIGTDMGPFWPLHSAPHPAKPTALIDYCIGTDEECNLLVSSAGEKFNGSEFKISPNPARDHLSVALPVSLTGHFSLAISDFTGKNIWQKSYSTTGKLTVPLENLPKGAYLLTLQTEGAVYSRKILKN